jgi:hypothetical protein
LQGLGFGETTRGTYECLLLEEHALSVKPEDADDNHEEPWYCKTSDELVYEINRPASWFQTRGAVSGETVLIITNADKVNGGFNFKPQMKINAESQIEQSKKKKNGSRRHLAPRSGTSTMLVIRGVSGDGAPTKSVGDLAVDVFGSLAGGVDPVNLASQYSACSKGKLLFVPATGGTNIVNGAVEVTIPNNIAGMNRITAHNLFINAAPAVVGQPLSTWTHTFLVMQGSVNFSGAAAYAYVNDSLSVYDDAYGSHVVVQSHELGHNIGLLHSGEAVEYDDHTCMMGNPAFEDDATIQCFNGAKSYFLGWYDEFATLINPSSASWRGAMVGVDDFVTSQAVLGTHTVVAKIEDASSAQDLYVMYNRAKGVNSGVKEYGNKVTVVRASNTASTSEQSYIKANLGANQQYRVSRFGGSGKTLVVQVCTLTTGPPDVAEVLVYLDGLNNLQCGSTNPPVASPTTSCPRCGNGALCCAPGVCSTSGKVNKRGCIV